MSLSEEDVRLRMKHFFMTEAQARQLAGRHLARHRVRGKGSPRAKDFDLIVEERDETGQIQRFIKDVTQHDGCALCMDVIRQEAPAGPGPAPGISSCDNRDLRH